MIKTRIESIAKGIYTASFEEHLTAQMILRNTNQSFVVGLMHHFHELACKLEKIGWLAHKLQLKQQFSQLKEHIGL